MIDIVCNIDENYIEYCGVMLASLFVHTPDEKFRVHIICSSKVEKVRIIAEKMQIIDIFFSCDEDYLLHIATWNDGALNICGDNKR